MSSSLYNNGLDVIFLSFFSPCLLGLVFYNESLVAKIFFEPFSFAIKVILQNSFATKVVLLKLLQQRSYCRIFFATKPAA